MITSACILVVEDEIIIARNLQNKLKDFGYDVPAVASSGQEAIDKAGEIRPDLVLMDIKLEGDMDGVEAAAQIRHSFDIPVVYLTAYADKETLKRARITEPYGYILKPITVRELLANIEMALYKHKMESELSESRRWFAATLRSIGDAVIATDSRHQVKFMNPTAEALTGWTEQEALGRDLSDVFNIRDEESSDRAKPAEARTILEASATKLIGHLLSTREGRQIPIEASSAPIKDDREAVTGAVLVFQDISERRQAEERIRRHNSELALLNRIIAISATSLEAEYILETTCRQLARHFGVPLAAATWLNDERTSLEVVAEYRSAERPALLKESLQVAGNPQLRRLLANKAPLSVDDVQNQPNQTFGWALLKERGTVSILMLPLCIEQAVVGALILESADLRPFSVEEVNLAWSVAEQVAGALARVQLDKAHRMMSKAIEQTSDSVIMTNIEGNIVYVNPAFEHVTGYSQAEVIGHNPRILKSDKQDDALYQDMWSAITAGQTWHGRFVNKRKDDSLYTEDATIIPVREENGNIVNYVAVKRDVTRELELEEQYRQAQKMEAIGRLTGGIAHDFNNLLTAINGYAKLAQLNLQPGDPLEEMIDNILFSCQHATNLVKQLLAFSRKQVIEPQVLNLNTIITDISKMLQGIIGVQIQVESKLTPDLWPVKVDPTQIEQVIVNLAVNARDAMPDGGQLTIETANRVLDDDYATHHLDVRPGEYVFLAVTDNGSGMTEEIQTKIFEPFFTTKAEGEGTGLGLATVFGIVKQSGGHIWVQSEVGRGTTFEIYLPRAINPAQYALRQRRQAARRSKSETVRPAKDD